MSVLAVMLGAVVVLRGTAADVPYTRSCTVTDGIKVSLPLRCPVGHMIHVIHTLTAIGQKGDISQCQYHSDCVTTRDSDVTGLLPFCNGRQSCEESIELKSESFCSNGTKHRYIQVQYECISEFSTLNVCSVSSQSIAPLNSSSIHVTSPAYPHGYTAPNQNCTCHVEGQGLSVSLLEVKFSERGATMFISNGTATLWSVGTQAELYNRDINGVDGSEFLRVSFNDNGAPRQLAWLRVTASGGSLTATCGRSGSLVRSSEAATTTQQPATSTFVEDSTSSAHRAHWTPSHTDRDDGGATADSSTSSTDGVKRTSSTVDPQNSTATPSSPAPNDQHTRHSGRTSVSPSRETTLEMRVSSHGGRRVDEEHNGSGVEDNATATATVTSLAVVCALQSALLLVFILYHCRRRLCGCRDPTYAETGPPVPEDTPTYTELRMYENLAAPQTEQTP